MLGLPGVVFSQTVFQVVGNADKLLRKVAVACGSAGEYLELVIANQCDAFLTGETGFHTCLEAEATDTFLILPSHYATERFAVESLAEKVQQVFPNILVWASKRESNPLQTL